MEIPQVRPGVVHEGEATNRVFAYFYNAAHGNSAIQLLTALGIPSDKLGVTPPERIEGGQGMVLSIPCPDEATVKRVESLCRSNGAQVHRQARRA
jgi:hypothetical protein